MSNRRIIYYYQTFSGLSSILKQDTPVTHIHLSAIHFGNNPDGSPYIHLNNYPPGDKRFDSVWNEINEAHNLGIKIVLMMGGSGSAFTDLFNNFDVYYPLVVETIKNHNVIGGIDLDVEEDLSKLADLTKRKNSTKDESLLNVFESQINDLQKSKKSHILEILNFVKEGEKILKKGLQQTVVYSNYNKNGIASFRFFLDNNGYSSYYKRLDPLMDPKKQFEISIKLWICNFC